MTTMSPFSRERTKSVRPRTAAKVAQGMKARQKLASIVPTQLARSELTTSPCISREKLVVMPQAGQGTPV